MIPLLLILTTFTQQDSIPVKITFAKQIKDSVYYQVKIKGQKERVNMICCCKQKYKAGDIILMAEKDIIIEDNKRKLFK